MRFDHDPESPERVVAVDLGVRQEAAVPAPTLLQNEARTFLVFAAREFGTRAIVEWLSCTGAVLGGLNDEAFAGHPLYARGLADLPYGAGEVLESAWVHERHEANALGYLGRYGEPPDPDVVERVRTPSPLRHFVMQFHDSSFECVALGFVSYVTQEPWSRIYEVIGRALASEDDEPLPFRRLHSG
jgi:hypothetical protein